MIIPNGVHVAAFADGAAAARPRPASTARRSASSAASTSRARACRCCSRRCTPCSPAPRRPVAHRRPGRRRRDCARAHRRGPARARRVARRDVRGRQGRVPALGRRLLRAEPGGESFGVVLIEALAAGAPDRGQRPRRVRPVLEDGEAGVLVRRGDPPPWPARCATCSPTPRGAPSCPPAARRSPPPTTGTCWRGASSPSTRPSCRRRRRGRRRGRRGPCAPGTVRPRCREERR